MSASRIIAYGENPQTGMFQPLNIGEAGALAINNEAFAGISYPGAVVSTVYDSGGNTGATFTTGTFDGRVAKHNSLRVTVNAVTLGGFELRIGNTGPLIYTFNAVGSFQFLIGPYIVDTAGATVNDIIGVRMMMSGSDLDSYTFNPTAGATIDVIGSMQTFYHQ